MQLKQAYQRGIFFLINASLLTPLRNNLGYGPEDWGRLGGYATTFSVSSRQL